MKKLMLQAKFGAELMTAATATLMLWASAASAQEVNLTFESSGASRKLGGYMPQRLQLSATQPEGLKKAPAGLTAPLYGQLKLGPAESPMTVLVVLDEPDQKDARLWVDANGNGDLTDDPPAEWQGRANPAGR